ALAARRDRVCKSTAPRRCLSLEHRRWSARQRGAHSDYRTCVWNCLAGPDTWTTGRCYTFFKRPKVHELWSSHLQHTADLSPRWRTDSARTSLVSVGTVSQLANRKCGWTDRRRAACHAGIALAIALDGRARLFPAEPGLVRLAAGESYDCIGRTGCSDLVLALDASGRAAAIVTSTLRSARSSAAAGRLETGFHRPQFRPALRFLPRDGSWQNCGVPRYESGQ